MKKKRFQRKNEKFKKSFFLLGLVVALSGAYVALTYNTQRILEWPETALADNGDETEIIPITIRKIEKPILKQKEVKKVIAQANQDIFIVVNDFTPLEEGQEEPIAEIFSEEEEAVSEVFFASLDRKPVYKGCEVLESEADRFECFQQKLRYFVADNYKSKGSSWGMQEKMYVRFVIDKKGFVTNVETNRGDFETRGQLERIVKKLPQFVPGMYKGKYVQTSYVLPVVLRN